MQKTYFSTTFQSRCRQAASYVSSYNQHPGTYWIALGKPSAWADDSNPPYPALTVNRVPELIGFVYIHTCECVYANSNGLIEVDEERYSVMDTTNPSLLSSAKANRVYFEALLHPDSTDLNSSYRVHALCTDIVFNSSPPEVLGPGLFLPPEAVASYFVDWVAHFEPVQNDGQTNQVIQIIKEF